MEPIVRALLREFARRIHMLTSELSLTLLTQQRYLNYLYQYLPNLFQQVFRLIKALPPMLKLFLQVSGWLIPVVAVCVIAYSFLLIHSRRAHFRLVLMENNLKEFLCGGNAPSDNLPAKFTLFELL